MRITIEIDDKLLNEAMSATGAGTAREAVEHALTRLVRLERQKRIRRYRGKLRWDDDLDRMRDARPEDNAR